MNDLFDFWKYFKNKTNSLEKPYLFENPVMLSFSMGSLETLFRRIARDDDGIKYRFVRGYIEGKEDYSLGKKVCDSFTNENCSFEDWLKFICNNQRFGIVLNGVLRWMPELAETLLQYTKPLLDNNMDTKYSLDATLFIGDYGYTPFGVHIDDAHHRTLLFNIGPNVKQMWLWDPVNIEKQFGKITNIYDMQSIHSDAKKYTIQKNQMFFLPPKYYHIGVNNELSCTLAVVISKIKYDEVLINELKKYIKTQESYNEKFFNQINDNPNFDFLFKSKIIKQIVAISKNRVYSNSGIYISPLLRGFNMTDLFKKDNVKFVPNKYFKIRHFISMTDSKFIIVLSRGVERKFKNIEYIKKLICLFNDSNSLSIDKLRENISHNLDDASEIVRFICFLYETYFVDQKESHHVV